MMDQQKSQAASPPASFTDRTLKYLAEFGKIFNALRMYDADHPTVKQGIEDTYAALRSVLEDRDALTIGVADGTLVIDEEHVRNMSPPVKRLASVLLERKIESFEITKALAQEEFAAFVKLIASKDESLWVEGKLRPDVAARFQNVQLNEVRYRKLRPGSEIVDGLSQFVTMSPTAPVDKGTAGADRERLEDTVYALIRALGNCMPQDGNVEKDSSNLAPLADMLTSMVENRDCSLRDVKRNLVKVLATMAPPQLQAVIGRAPTEGERPSVDAALARLPLGAKASILSAELERSDLTDEEISRDLSSLIQKAPEVVDIAEQISARLSKAGTSAENSNRLVSRLFDLVEAGALGLAAPKAAIQGAVYTADETLETSEPFAGILKRYECRFKQFNTGDELLAAARQMAPDLLILSGGVEGPAASKLLTELRLARLGLPDVPAIVCSPSPDCREDFDLLSYPECTFLKKPCASQEMIETIGRYLDIAVVRAGRTEESSSGAESSQDLERTRTIQRSLLPKELPEFPRCEIAVQYRACKAVGADYYDILKLGDGQCAVFVANVSGKGISGAMVMVMVRSVFRMVAPLRLSPKETMARVNQLLTGDMLRGMFVSAVYAVLDANARVAKVVSAGHSPPVLWRPGASESRLLKLKGIPLGLFSGSLFARNLEEEQLKLEPGDLLYLYTDGIVESRNPEGEEFGEERLCGEIMNQGDAPPDTVIQGVLDAVVTQRAGAPQQDDITSVALKIR
jgi:serine phosphatase RsbU (regulator of sigma subunit)